MTKESLWQMTKESAGQRVLFDLRSPDTLERALGSKVVDLGLTLK
jgi:hypothetical protein